MAQTLQNLDASLLLAIQSLRLDWLDPLVEFYTTLGNAGALWIVLSLILLCRKSTRKAGAAGLLALALGFVCTNVVLKHLVGRARPWLDVPGLIPLVEEGDPNSFPSGHTTAALAAAVAWARSLPRKWVGGLVVGAAVCMGLSRLYVGVHYPSDVLAGALVGAACGWIASRILERFTGRN